MKKILTIIPVYNKEEFLENAIESVLQQTYTNVQLVIVDDCSNDNSLNIAKSYEHLDNVTVLHNKENRGCYFTRNRGLEHFKDLDWDYFTIHDADDTSDVRRFEVVLEYFKDPNLLGLKTTYRRVNREMKQQYLDNGGLDIHASEGIAFYDRRAFINLGYFDNTRFSGDTDYWWRLEAFCWNNRPFRVEESKEELYLAIQHETNLTLTYDFHTTRPKYWKSVSEEIQTKMIPENNFYRTLFL